MAHSGIFIFLTMAVISVTISSAYPSNIRDNNGRDVFYEECDTDFQCGTSEVCNNRRCTNACLVNSQVHNTLCRSNNHQCNCICLDGFEGDAKVECKPMIYGGISNGISREKTFVLGSNTTENENEGGLHILRVDSNNNVMRINTYGGSFGYVSPASEDEIDKDLAEAERERAQREAQRAQREAERERVRAQRKAEEVQREAQRRAENAQREAQRKAENAQREAEKAQREAQRKAEKAQREAQKVQREARREAEKAQREAQRERECDTDFQCGTSEVCNNRRCTNACLVNSQVHNTLCRSNNHQCNCICLDGFEGDAKVECKPMIYGGISNGISREKGFVFGSDIADKDIEGGLHILRVDSNNNVMRINTYGGSFGYVSPASEDEIAKDLAEAEEDRKEARREAEEARKEAEEDMKEARREAEEARKEAEEDMKEARREAEEARKEAEEDMKEARREAEEARKEAEEDMKEARREAEEARKEAEEDRKEARREMEEARKEAEEDMKKARREAKEAQKEAEEDMKEEQREMEEARKEAEEDMKKARREAKEAQNEAEEDMKEEQREMEEAQKERDQEEREVAEDFAGWNDDFWNSELKFPTDQFNFFNEDSRKSGNSIYQRNTETEDFYPTGEFLTNFPFYE